MALSLDLSWAEEQLVPERGMKVLDAGSGLGIMQWRLSTLGVDVISADRSNRQNFPKKIWSLYPIQGLRKDDLTIEFYTQKIVSFFFNLWEKSKIDPIFGTIYIYNHDMRFMADIPDESIDGFVSISALEHNSPDELEVCINELMRILKPNGKLIATMAASKNEDWFHEPFKEWCYTESSLCELFNLGSDFESNFDKYDELFSELKNCKELQDNLADFYFNSGNNGMHRGVWDIQYLPVGIFKIKENLSC